jgi:SAM-dependent methyltransferase
MPSLSQWWRLAASAAVSRSNIAFYDRLSTIYDDIFVEHARHADNMIDVLAAHDAILANRHWVLDIGCGTGMLSGKLADRGFRALGVDPSLASLHVHRNNFPNIPVVAADAEHLPLATATFAAVLSLGTWRHIFDLDQATAEAARVLQQGGLFVVGYFPPAFGGIVQHGGGPLGRLMARTYNFLVRRLGYVDRADSGLERETMEIARRHFSQVKTQASGAHWRLIVAEHPRRSSLADSSASGPPLIAP